MKRDLDDDDEEMETEEDRAPKRSRLNERKAEFLDRRGDPRFRDLHHPEKIAKQALDQREHAAAALTSFMSDLKAGALTGPRLIVLMGGGMMSAPHTDACAAGPRGWSWVVTR